MKDLTLFINEKNGKSAWQEIHDAAWGILDYFLQEGVKGYDDDDIDAYAAGKKEIPFKDIAEEIEHEHKKYKTLSMTAYNRLKEYLEGKNGKNNFIEDCIRGAVDIYANIIDKLQKGE